MSWLKVSDAAAWHPLLMEVLTWSISRDEPWLVNEVAGFMTRLAVQSAQHELDYGAPMGVAIQTATRERFQLLIEVTTGIGLLEEVQLEGTAAGTPLRGYKIVEEEDLWHMIRKAEKEWERQRRADVGNPDLVVPVRARDGDACRWCGHVVFWSDRKGGRGATYDHLVPGKGAASADDLVVSCRSCNSARGDDSNTSFNNELRPVPQAPYYSAATVAFLAKHGTQVEPSSKPRITPAAEATGHQDTATAAEQAPQRESAPAQATAAPTDAAGSTAGHATAAPRQGVRDTASRPERQRAAQVRDARGPGEPAAAAPAQREADARRAEAERERRLDAWLADHGIPVATAPATALSPLDVEEADWAPSEDDAGPPGGPDLQIPADRQAEGSGFPGTGRDGTGREGPGLDVSGTGGARDGSGLDGGSAGSGRRRRRRGRRGGRGRGGEG